MSNCFGKWKDNLECKNCTVRHSCKKTLKKGSIKGYCKNCGIMSWFKDKKCIVCGKTYVPGLYAK